MYIHTLNTYIHTLDITPYPTRQVLGAAPEHTKTSHCINPGPGIQVSDLGCIEPVSCLSVPGKHVSPN